MPVLWTQTKKSKFLFLLNFVMLEFGDSDLVGATDNFSFHVSSISSSPFKSWDGNFSPQISLCQQIWCLSGVFYSIRRVDPVLSRYFCRTCLGRTSLLTDYAPPPSGVHEGRQHIMVKEHCTVFLIISLSLIQKHWNDSYWHTTQPRNVFTLICCWSFLKRSRVDFFLSHSFQTYPNKTSWKSYHLH